MRTTSIDTPNGSLFVELHGEDSPQIPLLVINGGPGAPHGYLESLAAFADERPVIFYDQLGTGQSGHPDDESLWTVPNGAKELAFVRDQLGLDQVHLYSHSGGSAYAIQHILDGGEVESNIMLSPMISAAEYNANGEHLIRMLPEEDREIIRRTESAPGFSDLVYPADLPEDYVEVTHRFSGMHWCRLNPPPQAATDAFGSIYSQLYQTLYGPEFFFIRGTLRAAEEIEQLGSMTTPTCIISGEFDWITPTNIDKITAQLSACE